MRELTAPEHAHTIVYDFRNSFSINVSTAVHVPKKQIRQHRVELYEVLGLCAVTQAGASRTVLNFQLGLSHGHSEVLIMLRVACTWHLSRKREDIVFN